MKELLKQIAKNDHFIGDLIGAVSLAALIYGSLWLPEIFRVVPTLMVN